MRTRVKICGVTRTDDALEAVACGVDALGFNFFSGSARYVDADTAEDIIGGLPAFVTSVGVFVDAAPDLVERVLAQAPLDLLQFHGNESPEYCQSFNWPYLKAIRATSKEEITSEAARFPDAQGLLIDSVSKGQFGGTGEAFDWQLVPDLSTPILLAGGLDAGNVGDAIHQVRPFAVDVSGGVEKSKGIKDAVRMRQFMKAVQETDRGLA